MTLCPVALAVGCRKCPVFSVCPLKSVIGDYPKDAPAPAPVAAAAKPAGKPKAAAGRGTSGRTSARRKGTKR